jgi:hypothetical protein
MNSESVDFPLDDPVRKSERITSIRNALYSVPNEFSHMPDSAFGCIIQQAVMPLVTKIGDRLLPLGTGFMIGSNGLMMTAKHVIREAQSDRAHMTSNGAFNEFYALFVSNERHEDIDAFVGGLIPISHVWCTNELDVGFCWLQAPIRVKDNVPLTFPCLRLSPGLPVIGEKILGFGYYRMQADSGISLEQIVDYSQKTAHAPGTIIQVYPLKRDAGMLNFPCFYTNARFEPGMSGGPIFNEAGSVCGMVCASMPASEDDPRWLSYGSLIWSVMGTEIEFSATEKTTIYDLAAKGYILTDASLHTLSVTFDENGKRVISVR